MTRVRALPIDPLPLRGRVGERGFNKSSSLILMIHGQINVEEN